MPPEILNNVGALHFRLGNLNEAKVSYGGQYYFCFTKVVPGFVCARLSAGREA